MGNTGFVSILFFTNSYISLHIRFLSPLHPSRNPSTHVHSTCQIISVITLHKQLLQEIRKKSQKTITKPISSQHLYYLCRTLCFHIAGTWFNTALVPCPSVQCHVPQHTCSCRLSLPWRKWQADRRRIRQERWKVLPRRVVEVQPLPPHCCFHSTIFSCVKPSLRSLHFLNQFVLLLDIFT